MGFDWEKFGDRKFGVYCPTQEDYDSFMKECDEHHFTWFSGEKVTEKNIFSIAKADMGEVVIVASHCREQAIVCGSKKMWLEDGGDIYEYIAPFRKTPSYRDNIIALMDKQAQKGMSKYGQTLEENDTLSTEQRIEHLQEELIDAMQYCEHLKRVLTDTLTANDYQRMAMRTAGEYESNLAKIRNAVYGLNGEAGEVIDLLKKHEFQGHGLDKEKLIDECGDCLWYAALLADALGVTLEDVMLRNVAKLKARYPDGFDKSRSINRDKSESQ